MAFETPILLLVFNRPEHTRKVIERLRQLRPQYLYVHADGPRVHRPDDTMQTAAVRQLISTHVDWPCQVQTLYRDENQGLRNGVKGALDWFFEAEPWGIVLEDDCLPDLSFFTFCDTLLRYYEHDERIMHIGGSNLAETHTQHLAASYVFSRFSFVWGWAGWRRAWLQMSVDLEGLDEWERSGSIQEMIPGAKAQYYMLDKFHVTQRKENNSWAYAWFYSILKNKGLCIVPKLNLVQNTGVGDATATNTKGQNWSAQKLAQRLDFPLHHPNEATPDPILERQFFYTSQKKKWRLWLWYCLKKYNLARL
jgi:hypothetical protein